MISNQSLPTRILIVNHDEACFQVQQCILKALRDLPPVELYHAHDATEALSMLDRLSPNVIVMDDEEPAEKELIIDSLTCNHPPILLQSEDEKPASEMSSRNGPITRIPKNESLEGLHQTLLLAVALGARHLVGKGNENFLH